MLPRAARYMIFPPPFARPDRLYIKYPARRRRRYILIPGAGGIVSILLSLSAGAIAGRACGPDFPNAYLTNSLDELSTLPTLDFKAELERLLTPAELAARHSAKRKTPDELAAAEIAEVREVLAASGHSPNEIATAIARYDRAHPSALLPPEFHFYARGARAYHSGDVAGAITAWSELLALPSAERQYRTVWASYMICRAECDHAPAVAHTFWKMTQDAARAGFRDSQELAAASAGWNARSYMQAREYLPALELYYMQFRAGEPSAMPSIQATLRRAFFGTTDPEPGATEVSPSAAPPPIASDWQLRQMAQSLAIRPIVTAWFAARGGPSMSWHREEAGEFSRWIQALGTTKNLTPAEADRWSWAAYEAGLWDDAQRLAAVAPADAPASEWVRAMLLLRGGFVADAADHLAHAARAFPTDGPPPLVEQPEYLIRDPDHTGDSARIPLDGVRGVLELRREKYIDALHIFLEAGHWSDAAYIAERVLSPEELMAFVASEWPSPPTASPGTPSAASRAVIRARGTESDVRSLLARRLMRAARFNEARNYFSAETQPACDEYIASVRAGYDLSRSDVQRGRSLWVAAQLARTDGLSLFGTELAPDYSIWDGSFEFPEFTWGHVTKADLDDPVYKSKAIATRSVISPTPNELQRFVASAPPAARFHYRYRAADLAWLAAGLLPNDQPETAQVLYTAGRWIANRTPAEADRFYKSLVTRCPHTELGRAAAALHWFPKEAPDPAPHAPQI